MAILSRVFKVFFCYLEFFIKAVILKLIFACFSAYPSSFFP